MTEVTRKTLNKLISKRYPGDMEVKGLNGGSISWNGIEYSALKSGWQKYIRRGILDKALFTVFEGDLFHEILADEEMDDKYTQVKQISTNLINRLMVISVEDIGIGAPFLPILISHCVEEYKKNRYEDYEEELYSHKRRLSLYLIVSSLVNAQKSRELSHIRTVYYQVYTFEGLSYMNDDKKIKFTMSDFSKKYPDIYTFDTTEKDYDKGFITEYDKEKDSSFHWLLKAFYDSEDKGSIMKMIDYVIKKETNEERKKTMKILKGWYKELTTDCILFAMQIVLIGLRKPIASVESIISPDLMDNKENESLYLQYYEKNVSGKTEGILPLDDYVIDQHTKEGKKLLKNKTSNSKSKDTEGRKKFANEGAVVTNEYPNTNLVYKEIYNLIRNMEFLDTEKTKKPTKEKTNSSGNGKHTCEHILTKSKDKNKNGKPCGKGAKFQNGDTWLCGIHNNMKSKSKEKDTSNKDSDDEKKTKKTPDIESLCTSKNIISQSDLDILYSKDTPRGQQMTGKNKKEVLIPLDGKYKGLVIKGPWSPDNKNTYSRLQTLIARMKVFQMLKYPVCPFSLLKGADDNYHLIFRNISTVDPKEWKLKEIEDKFASSSTGKVNKISRKSMGIRQMHKLSDEKRMDILFGKQFFIKVFIVGNLLRIGDLNPYNVITTNDRAYLIDYEENTTRGKFSEIKHIICKGSDKHVNIIKDGIKKKPKTMKKLLDTIESKLPEIDAIMKEYKQNIDIQEEWKCIKNVITSL